jgi:hypothetical protein
MSNLQMLEPEKHGRVTTLSWHIGRGLLYYCLSTAVVVLALAYSTVDRPALSIDDDRDRRSFTFIHGDGEYYRNVAENGYSCLDDSYSTISLFPAYPLCCRIMMWVFAVGPDIALPLVANVFLAGCFILWSAYLEARSAPLRSPLVGEFVMALFGVLPMTFVFRMAYSESLLVFLCLLSLYAFERKWPLLLIAVIIGLATATRPTGVALIFPLVKHILEESRTWQGWLFRLAGYVPVALWGVVGFMVYQYVVFGEPFAFVRAQMGVRLRFPDSWLDKATALLFLEPARAVFDSASPGYWRLHDPPVHVLFSLRAANCVYFVGFGVIIALGAYCRLLTERELWLSFGLLLIPYVARCYETCMMSGGRFAAVVLPGYIVMGHLLSRLPIGIAGLVFAISGFCLAIYTALFPVVGRAF